MVPSLVVRAFPLAYFYGFVELSKCFPFSSATSFSFGLISSTYLSHKYFPINYEVSMCLHSINSVVTIYLKSKIDIFIVPITTSWLLCASNIPGSGSLDIFQWLPEVLHPLGLILVRYLCQVLLRTCELSYIESYIWIDHLIPLF